MKTPVTKKVLQQHWAYHWWKYLVLVAGSILLWNMIYTSTAYRPPEDKKVNLYAMASTGDQQGINDYLEGVRERLLPEMEEVSAIFLIQDDTYAPVQLSTYLMAGEGDVYLLPQKYFRDYAQNGAFIPLEGTLAEEAATKLGIDLAKGYRVDADSGETHLFGIPAASLAGLTKYGIPVTDGYLSVSILSGNEENSIRLLSILLKEMQGETP